jgi:hypothetical protein
MFKVRPLSLDMADFGNLSPDLRPAFEQLVNSLNPSLRNLHDGLDGQLAYNNFAAIVREVEFTFPSPWQTLTLLNGFSAYGTAPACMKDTNGYVRLRGSSYKAMPRANQAIVVLPAAFRPAANVRHVVPSPIGPPFDVEDVNLRILTNGEVYSDASDSGVDIFSGALFPAASSTLVLPTAPFPLLVDVSELKKDPIGVQVLDCEDLTTGGSVGALYPRLSWDRTAVNGKRMISITNATNLLEGRNYRLTLLVT